MFTGFLDTAGILLEALFVVAPTSQETESQRPPLAFGIRGGAGDASTPHLNLGHVSHGSLSEDLEDFVLVKDVFFGVFTQEIGVEGTAAADGRWGGFLAQRSRHGLVGGHGVRGGTVNEK